MLGEAAGVTSAQPRVSVLFSDSAGAAGGVCAGGQPKGLAGQVGCRGDRGSSKCSREAVAGGCFVWYISRVLIQPWRGRIHHPGRVGTDAGFGKISSLNRSPGSRPPAGPGS